ncbi:MAG TPA: hypothetical protein VK897_19355 [Anaerolineales bacterium]|nr:hypothetical protein [Anaerolineales bacterium]
MTTEKAPSEEPNLSKDQALAKLAKRIADAQGRSWRELLAGFVVVLVINLLSSVITSLETINITQIDFPTLAIVVGGFILLFVFAVVIMRGIFGPPSKVKLLSNEMTATYLTALDHSILNPSNTKGGQNDTA